MSTAGRRQDRVSIATMTAEMNTPAPAVIANPLLPEPAPLQRTAEEKARILAHLTVQLAALDAEEEVADGHA